MCERSELRGSARRPPVCHVYTSDRSINVSAWRLDGRRCVADSQAGAGPARRRPCPAACTNEYARARFCALGVADDQITAYDPVSRPYAGPSRVPVLARLASLCWPVLRPCAGPSRVPVLARLESLCWPVSSPCAGPSRVPVLARLACLCWPVSRPCAGPSRVPVLAACGARVCTCRWR